MTITEALHHATQGGYHIKASDGMDTVYAGANSEYSVWTRKDNDSSFIVPVADSFLDPHFWHALGCGLGGIKPRQNILYTSAEINRLYPAPGEVALRRIHEFEEPQLLGGKRQSGLMHRGWGDRAPRILEQSMGSETPAVRQTVWRKTPRHGPL